MIVIIIILITINIMMIVRYDPGRQGLLLLAGY